MNVFISHATTDNDFASRLAEDLEKSQIVANYDDGDMLRGGENWVKKIQKAIDESSTVLVVVTAESAESEWVETEVLYAIKKKKPMMPILLRGDAETIPMPLAKYQMVDFRGAYDAKKYDEAFQNLLDQLQPHNGNGPSYVKSRPVPDLFIKNIFAIPEENPLRDMRMRELLSGLPIKKMRLLARSGFNYLHDAGKNYEAGVGERLIQGAEFQVILENPFSPSGIARSAAAKDREPWTRIPLGRLSNLSSTYPGKFRLRITDDPVYCSLFFTDYSVIYDPYHLGVLGQPATVGNQFLVFEFERPLKEGFLGPRDYYALLADHFEFLWKRATPWEEYLEKYKDELNT